MWKPAQSVNVPESTEKQSAPAKAPPSKKTKKPKSKGKGNDQEADVGPTTAAPSSDPDIRTVWIRSHPAVFDEVFSALQTSASVTLEAIKQSSSDVESPSTEVEIADLREHVNVFEIMGPKSNQVLKGALTPVGEDTRGEFKKVSE
jgi:ribonuclease P/MRP protein subunit POP1